MEHVMDLPHLGEVELVCNGGDNFDYREGSFSFWSKLRVGDGTFEVSGFKPDLGSLGKRSESSVVS